MGQIGEMSGLVTAQAHGNVDAFVTSPPPSEVELIDLFEIISLVLKKSLIGALLDAVSYQNEGVSRRKKDQG